ncbi:adenosylcobinamide-phosphate synthase CbiB [Desulfosarcina sp. OttesenSCG-928-A07]|nr:adenosylcobinamide-phosphate synthase CbiB [Desulfosarcina sp. OttesenSCG-928-G17]MDL2329697.1 adenosylcobinamide-phosphate synthase CbiB [Desulfosarcina sp. OttesenSCG-928-A07]
MFADTFPLVLTLAVLMDFLLGDPLWLPHPVRWMGLAIQTAEPRFRALPFRLFVSGGMMTIFLVAGTWGLSFCVVALADSVHPGLGIAAQVGLVYVSISTRSLADAAMAVAHALSTAGLEAGRQAVSMIVGRETQALDQAGVTRATVETVAENLVDGVIAPIFFACLGGGPLAVAYKMVNTLDSMVGYQNDRYREFGKFAARLDDAANFIPARLSVPFIALAAGLICRRGKEALITAFCDGRAHSSPNAGFPEAAFSGALKIWMGGPSTYHGRLVEKPVIGKKFRAARLCHIQKACRLMETTTLLVFMTAAVMGVLIRIF